MPPASIEQLPDLVDSVRPAIAQIDIDGRAGGSGFALSRRDDDSQPAVIVTMAHVLEDATAPVVSFWDESEYEATVRVVDPATDLALLTVAEALTVTLPLRLTRDMRVGEQVLALGSPFGLGGSVTTGIVSGLDRTRTAPNGIPIDNMVQTDALVNPGNSGGPLLGLDGCVLGVNAQSQMLGDGAPSGLSFAVASDTVRFVYDEVCDTGDSRIRRATLGTRTVRRTFTSAERRAHSVRSGAQLVDEPRPDGPAAHGGLLAGDVIVSFAGDPVDEPGDLYRLLDRSRIDLECDLEYLRGGERRATKVVPVERVEVAA